MIERKLLSGAQDATCTAFAPEIKRFGEGKVDADANGIFEGYTSLFNLRDLGNDIVMPGAFATSLRERGRQGVKLLWQHDAAQPIGSWLAIAEDGRGLKVRGRLNLQVAKAREVLSLMREGSVDGLSIGFRTRRARRDPATGLRRLYDVDLWEISLVTFPMLPQARVDAVKRGSFVTDGAVASGVEARCLRALRRTASLMR